MRNLKLIFITRQLAQLNKKYMNMLANFKLLSRLSFLYLCLQEAEVLIPSSYNLRFNQILLAHN